MAFGSAAPPYMQSRKIKTARPSALYAQRQWVSKHRLIRAATVRKR